MRILVVQTAFLGDLILSFPLLKQIKASMPQVHLVVVVRSGLGSFLHELKICDEVLEVKKKKSSSYEEVIQKLSNQTFDFILCPHESLRSALMVRKIKSPIKIGYKKFWNAFFFSKRVKKDLELPEALRQMQLLVPLQPEIEDKIQDLKSHYPVLRENRMNKVTSVPEWGMADFSSIFKNGDHSWNALVKRCHLELLVEKSFVVVAPGSVWETKKWTEKGFIELIGQFLQEGQGIILVGNLEEYELGERILSAHRALSKSLMNLSGKTNLIESLLLMNRAKFVIANDSGAQHLASLVQAPLVSIFGPTVLSQGFGPWQNHAVVVQADQMSCRPCGKHGHQQCPLNTHACMTTISAKQVYEATLILRDTLSQ